MKNKISLLFSAHFFKLVLSLFQSYRFKLKLLILIAVSPFLQNTDEIIKLKCKN